MVTNMPGEEDVLAALQNLLAWPEIARSAQLSRFLDYVVRAKLRGDEAGIKAYSIAVDVFDRPADFDPQTDPIVRVQARRLRGLMAQYYAGVGQTAPVRIILPTGRYVPDFVFADSITVEPPLVSAPVYPLEEVNEERSEPAKAETGIPPPRKSLLRGWGAALLVVVVLGALAMAISFPGLFSGRAEHARMLSERMTVRVMEFQRLTQNEEDVALTAGLAIDVVAKLNRSGLVVAQYGGAELSDAQSADFILSGTVRRAGAEAQYSAILTHVATEQVRWSKQITAQVEGRNQLGLTDAVSLRLASGLSSITGPILEPVRQALADAETDENPTLYRCRVVYAGYRSALSSVAAARSNQCYAQLPAEVKASGEVLAAQALLIMAGAGGSGYEGADIATRTVVAQEMLNRAIAEAPLNAFVWTQYARFSQERSDFESEEMAYGTARKLDPANPEILAAYSQSLAIAGRREAAVELFNIAVDSSINPPSWYYITPAMIALAHEDWEAVGRFAEMLSNADNLTAPLFGVMAGYRLGNATQLNQALPRLLDTHSFRENGIMPQLARRISDTQLLRVIRETLLEAGVPANRLDGPY